jgi:MFS family permease
MAGLSITDDDKDPAYGWVMVATVFSLTALAFGGLGTVGIFLKPLVAEFGWLRGDAAFGYTALSIAAAALGVTWGFVADKVGSRPLAFMSVIAMAISMAMLSQVTSLWQYYLAYVIFGAFGFSALNAPLIANVGFWFHRNPGLAIGITAAGGAFGQALFPFIAQLIITAYDWQTAYMAMAVVYLVVGLPICFLVRESPLRLAAISKPANARDDAQFFPVRPAIVIAVICFAVIFCCICMAVPIVHVVAMVSDIGVKPDVAASVLLVLMMAGIFGRIFSGKLADIIGVLPTFMIASVSQAVLAVSFPHLTSMWSIYLIAALFGVVYSGVMSSIVISVRMMVPPRMSARGMGFCTSFGMIGMGLGSFIGGYLFDQTGDYTTSFTVAGMSGLFNFVILIVFYLYVRRKHHGPDALAVPA